MIHELYFQGSLNQCRNFSLEIPSASILMPHHLAQWLLLCIFWQTFEAFLGCGDKSRLPEKLIKIWPNCSFFSPRFLGLENMRVDELILGLSPLSLTKAPSSSRVRVLSTLLCLGLLWGSVIMTQEVLYRRPVGVFIPCMQASPFWIVGDMEASVVWEHPLKDKDEITFWQLILCRGG